VITKRYFWDGERVLEQTGMASTNSLAKRFRNMPCMGVFFYGGTMYGKFTNRGWQQLAVERLPRRFKTTLLIMGVL